MGGITAERMSQEAKKGAANRAAFLMRVLECTESEESPEGPTDRRVIARKMPSSLPLVSLPDFIPALP
jgi:hypothetical protein